MCRTRTLRCESLESRYLLAATADVVLFVDQSTSVSQAEVGAGTETEPLYDWFRDTIVDLDELLVDRGIGSVTGLENRYSVVWMRTDGSNGSAFSGWETADDLATDDLDVGEKSLENGNPIGDGAEDAVESLWAVSPLEGDFPNLKYRNNAAVHYVVLTDGSTNVGEDDDFGPAYRQKAETNSDYHDASYQDIHDRLDAANLDDTSGGPNYVSDATITFLSHGGFDEDEFDTFGENGDLDGSSILGVDVNISSYWVFHDEERDESGPEDAADVFYYDPSTSPFYGRVEVADDFNVNATTKDYEDIRDDLLLATTDLVNGSQPNYGEVSSLDQDGYEGELYAFLTWESGGTFWDLDELLETGFEVEFRAAMVNDMFNKIARQVTDFDDDAAATDVFAVRGVMPQSFGDGQDIDEIFDMFGTTNTAEKAKFDLDGDNSVDIDDVILLVEQIYATWFGDAELDGDVDQDDDDILDLNWQQSVASWLDGDFNGDGVVNAADLNALGQNWLNGT